MSETRACDRSIHIGGLMRCCIQSIRRSDRESDVGSTLQCAICGAYSEVDTDGAWRWQPSLESIRERASGGRGDEHW